MSEIHRRRGFALLGAVLLVEAILGSVPSIAVQTSIFATGAPPLLVTLTHTLMPAALGTLLLASLWSRSFVFPGVSAAFATIVGLEASTLAGQLLAWGPGSSAFAFQPAYALLTGLGAPVLWASALVRVDHPANSALLKFGRVSAGMIQLGYVFQFVVRVRTWGMMGSVGPGAPSASAAGTAMALASLVEIATDLLLLWASVEALRTAADEDTVRRRALRSHRVMLWQWILLPVTGTLYTLTNCFASSTFATLGADLWRVALFPSVQVATTFVLARWYLLQFPASTTPLERSGGVVSTGEPT